MRYLRFFLDTRAAFLPERPAERRSRRVPSPVWPVFPRSLNAGETTYDNADFAESGDG